jgi:hypothetical protein
MRAIPSQCFQPSDALAERIVAWICEGGHEVDLRRDIESQLFGVFLATLQWTPLSAPLSQIGLIGPSSFERLLYDLAPWHPNRLRPNEA